MNTCIKKGIKINKYCNDLKQQYKEEQDQLIKEHKPEYVKEENKYRFRVKKSLVESVKEALKKIADKRKLFRDKCVEEYARDKGHEEQIQALNNASVRTCSDQSNQDMKLKKKSNLSTNDFQSSYV
ncbi:hypothetical protein PPERSA_12971 [Pseudocohnilembus persalinus]|uniref:Uncharacterized protein n=1 Tax=Pseudocohnilembus persalinus TaxID=266149 RepID=A0A0V0R2D1_PSEPJ|nr:hypothetical protein PPERSA_12971 [Pseudocohnilembus persalinus]|eukprot:KRX08490.1 hypothetical protein PPERSA_12971 [Pseudocohnilembus persalinus]